MSPYVTALLVYSIFLMAIGWWTSRSVRRAEDFFVAGRRLSPALLFGTLLAANLGAGSTVGATGLGYTHGISAWWWVGSAGIGSLILGLTVGPRMWRVAKEQNLYTVGDYLEHRYSRGVRGLIAVLLWFGSLAILAGQLIPLAWILNLTLGIPKYVACLAGGAVVVVYFTFGGLTSTARVNMVQLVVKLSGFILAFLLIVSGAGLLSSESAAPTGFESWFGDDPSRIWGYFIVLVPAFIISPGLLQKIYGARDARAVRQGVCTNAVALMLFAFIPALLGMAAYHAFPSLDTPDLALPRLLMDALPFWIGGLTLAAVFSAEISSADAVLFMLTTSLSRDLYQTYIDPGASEQRMLAVSRITAVGAGLAGVVLAAVLPDVITALTIFYSILSVALFVPLIAGLYSTRPNANGALATIAGSVLVMILVHLWSNGGGLADISPATWGIGTAVVIMALHMMSRRGTESAPMNSEPAE
ncbi:MAG: sodium:solute symporter family protein [Gemmatimonadota bacterium]|nr:sodium:solute symporter family protein [Gemmatimonadota bacterium]